MPAPLELRIVPSKRLLVAVGSIYLLLIIVALQVQPFATAAVLMTVVAVAGGWHLLAVAHSWGVHCVTALRFEQGCWSIQVDRGRWLEVDLSPQDTVLTSSMIALVFRRREPGRRWPKTYSSLVLPDSASADQRRKLRALLISLAHGRC